MVNVFPKHAGADLGWRARPLHFGVGDKPGDIEFIRFARLNGRALLEGEIVIEPLDIKRTSQVIVERVLTHV